MNSDELENAKPSDNKDIQGDENNVKTTRKNEVNEPKILESTSTIKTTSSNNVKSKRSKWKEFWNNQSPRARLAKFAMLSVALFFGAFIVNAIIVGVNLYSFYRNCTITFDKFAVCNLCNLDNARLDVAAKVRDPTGGLRYFHLRSFKPTIGRLLVPDIKGPAIIIVEAPTFEIGGPSQQADNAWNVQMDSDQRHIKLIFNEKANLKQLVEHFTSPSSENKRITINVTFSIKTNSFWVPVTLERSWNSDFEVPSFQSLNNDSPSSSSSPWKDKIKIQNVQLTDKTNADYIELAANVGIDQSLMPSYLSLDLPELHFQVNSRDSSREQRVSDISLIKQLINWHNPYGKIVLKVHRDYRDAIQKLIRAFLPSHPQHSDSSSTTTTSSSLDNLHVAIRGADPYKHLVCRPLMSSADDNVLSVNEVCSKTTTENSGNECTLCGLQKFLRNLEISKPVHLVKHHFMKLTDNNSEVIEPKLSDDKISIGLHSIKQINASSKFGFQCMTTKQYISSLIKCDVSKVQGTWPPLQMEAVLDYFPLDSLANEDTGIMEHTNLISILLEHIPNNNALDEEFLTVRLTLSLLDPHLGSQLVAFLMTKANNNDRLIRPSRFKKIVFRGVGDTLIGSLLSVFQMNIPLNNDSLTAPTLEVAPQPTMPEDWLKKLFFPSADNCQSTEQPPKKIENPVAIKHELAAALSSSERQIDLKAVLKLHHTPIINQDNKRSGPRLQFYWDDIKLALHSVPSNSNGVGVNTEGDAVELLSLNIQKGHFHVNLGNWKDFDAMVHEGSLMGHLTIQDTPSLASTLKGLLQRFAYGQHNLKLMLECRIPAHNNPNNNITNNDGTIVTLPLQIPPWRYFPLSQSEDSSNNRYNDYVSHLLKYAQLRLVGLKTATLQAMLRFPLASIATEGITAKNKDIPGKWYQSQIKMSLALPPIDLHLCNQIPSDNGTTAGDLTNNRLCVPLCHLGIYPVILSAIVQDLHLKEFHASSQQPVPDHSSDWIPMTGSILDFERLVEVLDAAASGLPGLSVSPCHVEGDIPYVVSSVNLNNNNNDNVPWMNLLSKLIGQVGAQFPMPLNENVVAPQLPVTHRPPIKHFYEDTPVQMNLQVDSPSWQDLTASIDLVIPPECFSSFNNDNTPGIQANTQGNGVEGVGEHHMTLEWGATQLDFDAEGSQLQLTITPGQIDVRLTNSITNEQKRIRRFTNVFKIGIKAKLAKADFNSGDARRLIHHIRAFVMNDTIPEMIQNKRLQSRIVKMKATVQPFTSLPINETNASSTSTTYETQWHVQTIFKILKAMLMRANARPSHLNDLWNTWQSTIRFLPPNNQVDDGGGISKFPCLIPAMCHNGLLAEKSSEKEFISLDTTTTVFVQLLYDWVALIIGRMLSKLDLSRHPRHLLINPTINDDISISACVNDIDMAHITIRRDQFTNLSRTATIIYPGEGDDINNIYISHQITKIQEDSQRILMSVAWPKFYHDFAGLLQSIFIDPLFRLAIRSLPKYISNSGHSNNGEYLTYSPLSLMASNERMLRSNLLSTLACLSIAEMPTGHMVSQLGTGNLNVSALDASPHGVTLQVKGICLPNPATKINILLEHPLLATYLFKRDPPLPQDPPLGFSVASGKIIPVEGESFPMTLQGGTSHPVILHGSLSLDAQGALDPDGSDLDRLLTPQFVTQAALGKELKAILKLDLQPNLTFHLPVDFPVREVDLAFLDTENSNIDPRSVHVVTRALYHGSRNLVNRATSWGQSLRDWYRYFFPSSPNTNSNQSNREIAGDPFASPTLNMTQTADEFTSPPTNNNEVDTSGRRLSDVNFALSLKNFGDFTMAIQCLQLTLLIDDSDGLTMMPQFPRQLDRILKGHLLLAHPRCHFSNNINNNQGNNGNNWFSWLPSFRNSSTQNVTDSGDTRPIISHQDFLQCVHSYGAGMIGPNEHLRDNRRLLAPVQFESWMYYVQAIDEIVNHDGLCMNLEGTFSLGIVDERDRKFIFDLPVNLSRIAIPRLTFPNSSSVNNDVNNAIIAPGTKKMKHQSNFDPCHKLNGPRLLTRTIGLPLSASYTNSPSQFLLNVPKGSSAIKKLMDDNVPLESSFIIQFVVEFSPPSMIASSTACSFSIVFHYDESNNNCSGGDYGLGNCFPSQSPSYTKNSVALGFKPFGSDSVTLLLNNVSAYEKKWATFPSVLRAPRRVLMRIRHLSYERRFIIDTFALEDGENPQTIVDTLADLPVKYHSIVNLERQPDISPNGSRGPSLLSYLSSPGALNDEGENSLALKMTSHLSFAATGNHMGVKLVAFRLHLIRPDLSLTKVYWPERPHHLPFQRGRFIIVLHDQHDHAMANYFKDNRHRLRVQLRLIDSHRPRSVIPQIPDDDVYENAEMNYAIMRPKYTSLDSLMTFSSTYKVECQVQCLGKLGLYEISYIAALPGRYAIFMTDDDVRGEGEELSTSWVKVNWDSIYVRHFW